MDPTAPHYDRDELISDVRALRVEVGAVRGALSLHADHMLEAVGAINTRLDEASAEMRAGFAHHRRRADSLTEDGIATTRTAEEAHAVAARAERRIGRVARSRPAVAGYTAIVLALLQYGPDVLRAIAGVRPVAAVVAPTPAVSR